MEDKFKDLIKEVFEIDKIKLDDTFREYDSWDSLTNISLIAMLDDEYDVIIDTSKFKKILTIGELYNEIKKRIS